MSRSILTSRRRFALGGVDEIERRLLPTLTVGPVPTLTVQEGQTLSTQIQASEPAVFSLDEAPAGMTISPAGQLDWTPPNQEQDDRVTVRATTCQDAATVTFRVFVFDPAPVIAMGGNQDLPSGGSLSRSGSFTTFSGNTYVGMVNYGDGSGFVPLVLNPDSTFALSHQYDSPGNHQVVVVIDDSQDGQGQAFFNVQVASVDAPVAPVGTGFSRPVVSTPQLSSSGSSVPAGATTTSQASAGAMSERGQGGTVRAAAPPLVFQPHGPLFHHLKRGLRWHR
jgi:hypothetical protein